MSDGTMVADRIAAADEDDGARQLVSADRVLDERRNRRKAGARLGRHGGDLRRRSAGRCEGCESQRREEPLHGIQYILASVIRYFRGFEHASRLHLSRAVLAAL